MVWPFVINAKWVPLLTLEMRRVSLSSSARAQRGPASVQDSCCHGGKGSGRGLQLLLLAPTLQATGGSHLHCFPKGETPQKPSHLLRTAISATKTPPVCSMRCFRLSHVSRDQRESHVYQKKSNIIKKNIQTQFSCFHPRKLNVSILLQIF